MIMHGISFQAQAQAAKLRSLRTERPVARQDGRQRGGGDCDSLEPIW